jgi:DNA-binding IclR family transcriptional regulator
MATKKWPPPTPPADSPSYERMGRELSDALIFFHEAVASHLGMSAAEWKCLGLLEQHGPATAGRLAALSGFTTGAITGIVDRLERGGYVRRSPHPHDRRSVIIKPLHMNQVKRRVMPIFQSLGRAMAVLASHYTAPELAAITAFFGETAHVLRRETTKLKRAQQPRARSDR